MVFILDVSDDWFRDQLWPMIGLVCLAKLESALANHSDHQHLRKLFKTLHVAENCNTLSTKYTWCAVLRCMILRNLTVLETAVHSSGFFSLLPLNAVQKLVVYNNNMFLQFMKQTQISSIKDLFLAKFYSCTEFQNLVVLTPKLQSLSLVHCDISDKQLTDIAKSTPFIKAFRLTPTRLSISASTIDALARSWPQLQQLSLARLATLYDTGLLVISQSCPHLIVVDIRYCPNITCNAVNLLRTRCKLLKKVRVTLSRVVLPVVPVPVPVRTFTEAKAACLCYHETFCIDHIHANVWVSGGLN
jgi:hypothetical protein